MEPIARTDSIEHVPEQADDSARSIEHDGLSDDTHYIKLIPGLPDGKTEQIPGQADGKTTFKVTADQAKISSLISTVLENEPETTQVVCGVVSASVLKHVVEYMQIHNGKDGPTIPRPLSNSDLQVALDEIKDNPHPELNEADAKFANDLIENNRRMIYHLINAAVYMGMTGLYNLVGAATASMVKGKPLSEYTEILAKGTEWEGQQRPSPEAVAARKAKADAFRAELKRTYGHLLTFEKIRVEEEKVNLCETRIKLLQERLNSIDGKTQASNMRRTRIETEIKERKSAIEVHKANMVALEALHATEVELSHNPEEEPSPEVESTLAAQREATSNLALLAPFTPICDL